MKFTLSWLKEHLETAASASAIADRLTGLGLEVESIEDAGERLGRFIVAEIVSAEKHPNADKLKLCMVGAGEKTLLQIVCGAPNARSGLKTVLARPGTVIPVSGEVLRVGVIRGVESRGMLCSARELLLGDDPDGIIELPADSRVGETAAPALGRIYPRIADPVLDVAITPNRGDAASVFGIARELAAAGLGSLKPGKIEPVAGKFPSPRRISLDFSPPDRDACPVFAGRLIRNVKNRPSPPWVRERLQGVGMKSISALVDATNLIAQDRGRPLHVFDADKLSGNLCARMAKDGESLLALDGKTYVLDADIVVIADNKRAQSIAGIMGGAESGCSLETGNVFIESAWFDPLRVARAGRRLGIVSDARYRFERGVDPQFVLPGLELCTRLILEWCGGEPSDVVIAGELPPPHRHIMFDPDLVESLGGIAVGCDESIRILSQLGFTVLEHGGVLHVTPPSYRHDIDGPADLVEEIVRIHGLSGVAPVALPRQKAVAGPSLTAAQRRERSLRRVLAASGFHECVSFSFIARDRARLFGGGDEARQLANPIAQDLDALRPSPLPSLLLALSRNGARGFSDVRLFEVGPAFRNGMPEGQTTNAAGIIAGPGQRDWTKSFHPANEFDAKAACLTGLEAALGGPVTAPVLAGAPLWFHPGRSGTVALGGTEIAWFGALHPTVMAAFDLKLPVAAFEINLDALPVSKAGKARPPFAPSAFQAVERDFAFVVDAGVPAGEIVKAARMADRALVERVTVFDVYEGKGIVAGNKSIAIAVRIQPTQGTLTEKEIEALAEKVIAAVAKATGASLRT
ncbi:MAG: phenylalanine--tRNA ligase subunit beta [Rhizomicrobium sp.]